MDTLAPATETNGPCPVHHGAAAIDAMATCLHATRHVLARLAIEDVLTVAGRRKLQAEGGVAALIEVPSDQWIAPVRIACLTLCAWSHIVCRSSPDCDHDDALVSDRLGSGGRVLGIALVPELDLPRTLVAAADLRITLRHPSTALIRRAIKAVTGHVAGRIPRQITKTLTFDDLAAALRHGSVPSACISRMKAAAQVRAGAGRSRDLTTSWQNPDDLRANILLDVTRLRRMLDGAEYDDFAGEIILALGCTP